MQPQGEAIGRAIGRLGGILKTPPPVIAINTILFVAIICKEIEPVAFWFRLNCGLEHTIRIGVDFAKESQMKTRKLVGFIHG